MDVSTLMIIRDFLDSNFPDFTEYCNEMSVDPDEIMETLEREIDPS